MLVNIIMGDKCTKTAAKTKNQSKTPKPNNNDGYIIKSKNKMLAEKKIEMSK